MLYTIKSGDGGTTDGEDDRTTGGSVHWATDDVVVDDSDDGTGQSGKTSGLSEGRPRPVSDGGVVKSLTDPASLADNEGTEFLAQTRDPDKSFHDADVDGAAIVGVTDGDGSVHLLEHPEQPPILPMCRVEPDGDWAAVGRGTVDDVPGLEIDLVAIERVRTLEYADDDGQTQTNHYVIFRGAVAPDGELPAEPTVEDPDWEADWYETVDGRKDDDMAADIRLFLD